MALHFVKTLFFSFRSCLLQSPDLSVRPVGPLASIYFPVALRVTSKVEQRGKLHSFLVLPVQIDLNVPPLFVVLL